MNDKYRITVFTPTFNRGYIIEQLYKSLLAQTYKDFEWLIIDNGTDETEQLVKRWIDEKKLTIVYRKDLIRVGLNRAYNDALGIARGDIFFKVDDDDYLTKDSLELVDHYASTVNSSKIAAVSGLRAHLDGKIIGGRWKAKENIIDASNFDRNKYGLGGDKAEAYFTRLLREYAPLPEVEGEKYTDEAILFSRIADAGFLIRWFNKPIYVCEYRDDGVTMNWEKTITSNPITYRRNINEYLSFKHFPFTAKIKKICLYCEVFRNHGFSKVWIFEGINYNKTVLEICWALSYLTFVKRIYNKWLRNS